MDDKNNGAIVVVMQRLHIEDLAGYLIEQGGWQVLSLPAIAEEAQAITLAHGRTHYRAADDVLHPERESLAILEQLRREMGAYDFSAQYQQAPVPPGGAMIKWDWFGRSANLPRPGNGSIVVQSWDTASTTSELASYSVGITALIDAKGTIWITDVVRGRWSFPDLKREILKAYEAHQPKTILIEDHSSGIALQQILKRDGLPVIAIKPKGDKVIRMHANTAELEAAKVFLPKEAPWIEDFRNEILAFPCGTHSDQVDALSQLMTWTEERRQRSFSIKDMRW